MSRLLDRRLHRRARSARDYVPPVDPAPRRELWWEDWAIGAIVVTAIANGLYLVFTN